MCRQVPASWSQTGTSRRGRRSSRSASAAESRCSSPEGNRASEPHEPSAAPYTPSQNPLHASQSAADKKPDQKTINRERKMTTNNSSLPLTARIDQGCVFQYEGFSTRTPGPPRTWRCGPNNSASLWSPPRIKYMRDHQEQWGQFNQQLQSSVNNVQL